MKGKLHKTEQGWVVRHPGYVPPHEYELPVHPNYIKYYFLDEDADGAEVEFEVVEVFNKNQQIGHKYINYAKLIKNKLKKLTEEEWVKLNNEVKNDNSWIIWDEIYDEYSTEQFPPFGGPFTNSISFIDWLKENYKSPERI